MKRIKKQRIEGNLSETRKGIKRPMPHARNPLNPSTGNARLKERQRPTLVLDSLIEPDEIEYARTKKRLFIGLVMGASTLVCLFLISLWVIPFIGLTKIHPAAPWIFGGLIFIALFVVAWASFGLVLNIISGKALPFFKRMRGVTVKLFLPLMMLLARMIGLSKDKVRSSFIKVNNELVASGRKQYKPKEILLLMPHCLQRSDCTVRLTYGVHNCKRCGKCPMTGLIELSQKYGVHLAIATGGTIARRIVVQKRPKIILAVACERDLSSGIQDTYPLPVYGILNNRPFGPCLNTQVSLNQLEDALRFFISPEHLPERISKDAVRVESPYPLNKSSLN
jgi:uncharacterized protein